MTRLVTLVLGCALFFLVGACAITPVAQSPTLALSRSPASSVVPPALSPPSASGTPAAAPTTARLVCDGTRSTLLDPVVRPQPDGVHFDVQNTSGRDLGFTVIDYGGDNAPAGETTLVWPLAPGAATVGCEDSLVPITIVDPASIYVPAEPDCADGGGTTLAVDYPPGATGLKGDAVDVARARLRGLLPGDVVERVGYPASPVRLVGVLRAGRLVAVAHLTGSASGGWLIETLGACSDAKIGIKDAD